MKLVSLFLLLSTLNSVAQTNQFVFEISTSGNDKLRDIHETDSYFYITGSRESNSGNTSNMVGFVYKIFKDGTLYDSALFNIHDHSYHLSQLLEIRNDTFMLSGALTDTNASTNSSLLFYKIDSNLTVLDSAKWAFNSNYELLFNYAHIGINNELSVTGGLYPDEIPFRMFVYRFSPSLDSLKFKLFYDQPNKGTMGVKIRQIAMNKYWICEAAQGTYYVLDSSLNILSTKQIPKSTYAPFGTKWDTDSSFYISGQWNYGTDDDITLFHQTHYADTNIDYFKWWGFPDTLDMPASRNGLDFKHKDTIYISGTKNYQFSHYYETPSWCFVLQTDSTLDIRWEKFIGGDANYRTQMVIATNDGGCLIGATYYDYQHSSSPQLDMRVIKLNKHGHLVSQSESEPIQTSEAIVYPNPGNEHLKIRIAAQHPQAVFALYSIDGKLLINKKLHGRHAEINASALKPGTYIYKIFNSKGLNESGKWIKK